MPRSERDWLFRIRHIHEALDRIRQYIEGMDFESFQEDSKTVDASLRNLAVIGEAARHVPTEITTDYPEIPWNEMRGMRNIVIHEYFGVSLAIVWRTLERDLPLLRQQIEAIIGQEGGEGFGGG